MNIVVLAGGISNEREVSICSGIEIWKAVNDAKKKTRQTIQDTRESIQEINQQLDDVLEQLQEMNTPLEKAMKIVRSFNEKVLSKK